MHKIIKQLKLSLAKTKTFIASIEKSFDFLDYRFEAKKLVGLAKKTKENVINKVTKLYEQGATKDRIGSYIKRWSVWALAGI